MVAARNVNGVISNKNSNSNNNGNDDNSNNNKSGSSKVNGKGNSNQSVGSNRDSNAAIAMELKGEASPSAQRSTASGPSSKVTLPNYGNEPNETMKLADDKGDNDRDKGIVDEKAIDAAMRLSMATNNEDNGDANEDASAADTKPP